MTTIATLDGSLRTVELGTLEAIELCEGIVRSVALNHMPQWATLAVNVIDAHDAYRLTQSDNELTAADARDTLDILMRETESVMYELGFSAYWSDGTFYIETINEDGSETD